MKREKLTVIIKFCFAIKKREKIKSGLTFLFWNKKKTDLTVSVWYERKLRVILNVEKENSDVKKVRVFLFFSFW